MEKNTLVGTGGSSQIALKLVRNGLYSLYVYGLYRHDVSNIPLSILVASGSGRNLGPKASSHSSTGAHPDRPPICEHL